METTYYLAVDIGASSGRHMLSHLEDGKLVLEEIYRFPNGMTEKNGHKVWDVERLFAEILNGMKQCARLGKIPHSMGIDTWAVDYVLLDGQGRRIGDAAAYRDGRTQGMDKKVYAHITEEELYRRTGIQNNLNTIYQLAAVREHIQNTRGGLSADDAGLFSFSSDRERGAGVYQCDDDPAGQPGDKGLG